MLGVFEDVNFEATVNDEKKSDFFLNLRRKFEKFRKKSKKKIEEFKNLKVRKLKKN
jgi:hypothetical protein